MAEGDQFVVIHGAGRTSSKAPSWRAKKCVIVEGFEYATLTNGKAKALYGMMTTNDCPLLSTLNDDLGNETGAAVPMSYFLNVDGQGTG